MKLIIRALSAILLLVIMLPVIIIAFINTPPGRVMFSKLATQMSGRQVVFTGSLYPSFSHFPGIHVSGLSVANTLWAKPEKMAVIGTLDAGLSLSDLLNGKLVVSYFSLGNSEVHLEKNAKGLANWTFGTPSDTPSKPAPPIKFGAIYLKHSVFTYRDDTQHTDIALKGNSTQQNIVVSGKGKHLAQQFALRAQVASRCFTEAAPRCSVNAQVTIGHTSAHIKGILNGLMPPSGIDVALDIKGADAADLYPLIGLVSPPTPPYHINGQLQYSGKEWQFNRLKGTLGKSDINGFMAFDPTGKRPKLSAKLNSETLRLSDLKTFIGIAPEQQVSEEQKKLAAEQAASATLIPDLPLDIEKVSSMDADVTFNGKHVISDNLPLEDFFAHVTLNDRLLKLKPVRFGSAQGDITANVSINARKNPVEDKAHITFDKMKLAGLLKGVGSSITTIQPATGDIGGTVRLSGYGKSLHEMLGNADGSAGIGMEGGSISHLLIKLVSLDIAKSLGFIIGGDESLPIRCLVADFQVKDGHMQTRSLVFDTADTLITAKGGVNLEKERLGMEINPSPKNATLLSLRSPIDITGSIKNPNVSIQKGPIAQRGVVATGLAVLAPVAAVAAFVGTGEGEDSDCGALMRQMHMHTGTNAKTDSIPDNTVKVVTPEKKK